MPHTFLGGGGGRVGVYIDKCIKGWTLSCSNSNANAHINKMQRSI